MGQIKSTTTVKRSKEVESYKDVLKSEVEKEFKHLEELEPILIQSIEAYKKLPFDNRHNSEEYFKLKDINKDIESAKDNIGHLIVLTSDVLYANINFDNDIRAYEVIKMKSNTCFNVRRLKATLLNKEEIEKSYVADESLGTYNSGIQDWDFEVDKDGEVISIKKTKTGWMYDGNPVYLSGEPIEFYEFNV